MIVKVPQRRRDSAALREALAYVLLFAWDLGPWGGGDGPGVVPRVVPRVTVEALAGYGLGGAGVTVSRQ